MFKKSFALLSVGLLAASIVATPVMAADIGAFDSTATVSFKDVTESPQPVDPNDPTKPIEIEDGREPLGKGLVLVSAPNKIDFGEIKMTFGQKIADVHPDAHEITFAGTENTEKRAHATQVADYRGGGQGWNLSVKQTQEFISEDNESKLTGAELKFTNASFERMHPDGLAPNDHIGDGLVVSDDAANVMSATKNEVPENFQGIGGWIQKYGSVEGDKNNGISLMVPKNVAKDGHTYTSKLLWTLSSAE